MTKITIESLQRDVMKLLLAGDDEMLHALRLQYAGCTIKDVELTGVGVFVNYILPEDIAPVEPGSFEIGDVAGEMEGLANGCGFLLFVREGIIKFLEAYTYDEPWPDHIATYQLRYHSGVVRDLVGLRKNWLGAV